MCCYMVSAVLDVLPSVLCLPTSEAVSGVKGWEGMFCFALKYFSEPPSDMY